MNQGLKQKLYCYVDETGQDTKWKKTTKEIKRKYLEELLQIEELKKLKIKYNKIRGMKDEQSVFLRLSDAMAGFLREVYEKHEYAVEFMKRFKDGKVVIEA